MRIKWGNKNTQDFRVAAYLNTGARLTPMSAQVNLDGISRLASRVNAINNMCDALGQGRPITCKISRTANGRRYGVYSGTVSQVVLEML